MLDRLKEAYYRRHHGSERADLILRVEREIAHLPRKKVTREWADWLWSLPHEAWLDAVALKKAQVDMLIQREVAVQTITRKNKLLYIQECSAEFERRTSPYAETELEAVLSEAERLKAEAIELELDVRARSLDLHERFGILPEDTSKGALLCPGGSVDRKADRWQAWLKAVPPERQDEARRVRALHADLDRLKKKIVEAVTQKNRLETDGAEQNEVDKAKILIQAMKEERDLLDTMYRNLSRPLFEAAGEPRLAEYTDE